MATRLSHSLRLRTLATILAILVPGTAALLLVGRHAIRSSFDTLERAEARQDVARCVEALASEVDAVRRVVSDYGQWDDSYEFIASGADAFVRSNLTVETFAVNRLEVVWYVAPDGRVVFGRCYDLATREPRELKELPATAWLPSHPLLGRPGAPVVAGFLPTSLGTLVVAARPVTTSDGKGAPRGQLAMGRFLSATTLDALRARTSVAFDVLPVDDERARGDLAELAEEGAASVREADGDMLEASRLVRDVTGRPLLVVRARVPRDISAQGRAAALWASLYGVLVAAGILLALHRFFGRAVVKPVTALGDRVREIAANLDGATSLRLAVERRDEIGRLAEDVNLLLASLDETRTRLREARDVAEAASAAKGRFVAHMSHELRTPVNGILGMTQVLLRSDLDADQRRCAETVKVCSASLLAVIGDVLDLAKIEADRLTVEAVAVPIDEVIEQALVVVGPTADSKGLGVRLRVEPDVPSRITTDPTRVRQVLVNLLGNAVKFTAKGEIELRVSVVEEPARPRELRLAVADSGVGIPASRLERLFRPFEQGDASSTRRYGGTGLGLAISRGIVRALGGRIGVESVEGRGSTFWFTLPLVDAAPDAVRPAPAPASTPAPTEDGAADALPAFRRLRVLVAEDNDVNQEVARRLLSALGHEAVVVADGREAVERAIATPFDVVLMDVQMPRMDGYEAAAWIRARERDVGQGRHVPIVALTASVMEGEREFCLASGMDDFLPKPIRLDVLDRVLRRVAGSPSGASAAEATSAHATPAVAEPARVVAPDAPPPAFDVSGLGLPPERTAELALELANLFRVNAPSALARMRAAADVGDAAELARQAHALKGSCMNLRAPQAVAELAAIEQAARGGDAAVGRSRLPVVETSIAAILAEAETVAARG